MGKKRILVYTESYLPSVGGLENNTLLLCSTLINLGHKVTLLTPQNQALAHAKFHVLESRNMEQYFKTVKHHDVILVNGGISFKIIIPALLLHKPYVVIYQMASLFRNINANSFKIRLTNQLRKQLAKKADLNVAVSRYSHKELIGFFGNQRSALLINPANPMFEKTSPKKPMKQTFDCLFAGRLIEGKGIRLLITAIEKLRAENLSYNLHIVGEGPEEEWIKSRMDSGFIFLHPSSSPEKLRNWYGSVELTVIPSTSHTEGSPLVMAESLTMGTPVLVANQPAMLAAVNHKNMSFISGDLNDLTNKLRSLLNVTIYQEVLAYSDHLAKDFHYENYISQLEKIVHV